MIEHNHRMKQVSHYLKSIDYAEYDVDLKAMLLAYMTQKEFLYATTSKTIRDFVSGENVMELCRNIYRDGEFEWRTDEVYLLEKYNLKIVDDFIEHVRAAHLTQELQGFIAQIKVVSPGADAKKLQQRIEEFYRENHVPEETDVLARSGFCEMLSMLAD